MWNSIDSLRTLSQALIWLAFGFAILAAAATAGRYFVDRRWNELRAAERAAQEEVLRTKVNDAEARAREAEVRASTAARRADEAHALANRHEPQMVAVDIANAVVGRLRPWAAKSSGLSLELVVVGPGDPGVDHAAASLARLLRESGVAIVTSTIGIAVGLPRGALVIAGASHEAAGRELAAALKPLIENVAVQVRAGARLTLHINGGPSLKPDGSFTID